MGDDILNGLLLTRQWRDTSNGVELTFWFATTRGPAQVVVTQQEAVCFLHQDDQSNTGRLTTRVVPRSLTALHSLSPVSVAYFRNQRDLLQFREQCRLAGVRLYESDIKPADRYLMERFIRCGATIEGKHATKDGYLLLHNPKLKPALPSIALKTLSLDIETDGHDGQIISIACSWKEAAQSSARVFIHAHEQWRGNGVVVENASTTVLASEQVLLQSFFTWLKQHDPDVIIGWNVIGFDLAYIQKRCSNLNIPFAMARAGARAAVLPPGRSGQIYTASVPGRLIIDGIESLRAAFWHFESFSLEFVAQALLGQGKLIEESRDKIAEIKRLYAENPDELLAYNIRDCQLVEDIFEKTRLIEFVVQRSQLTGLALGRIGGSVAAFDNLYLPKLHRRGFVAGDIDDIEGDVASPGGFVLDSLPGLYDNVLVLDFKSLYPSIIRSFLIDPLGLALDDENQVPGFHGASFSRNDPILPELIGELWNSRDAAKWDKNEPLSQAIKIIMNSFYGVLGTSACRFHDHKLASSITRRGHEIIQRTRDEIEAAGYTVIYGDTDSVFVLLGDKYSHEESRNIGDSLVHTLNSWWTSQLAERYAIESFLELEFETHFARFLMPTVRGDSKGSKKRYAGMLEVSGKQELVFKGMESVRSDWTPLAREFQRELYRLIFTHQPYHEYILETVEQLCNGERDALLGYRKRLRKPLSTYTKNVPPHVQAANKLPRAGRWIRYFMTIKGPEPEGYVTSPFDYDHYIERQLAPAADSILSCLDTSFEQITSAQLAMF